MIEEQLMGKDTTEPAVIVYLLGNTLNHFINSTEMKEQEEFVKVHNSSHSYIIIKGMFRV